MQVLVQIALKRPYTFVVLALLILISGIISIIRTPVDIFPEIRIPVIAVAWQYTGLPSEEMAGRIVTPFERSLTTTVNDIEHIEGNSYNSFGVIKIFFHKGVNIAVANAQVTAIAQAVTRQMPTGTTPPLILNYNASTVPILQVALSGNGLSEQKLADLAMNVIRTRLITVQGAAIPYPFGGKSRQVQIDLDPVALQSRGLSAQDVANALAVQNLIIPIGSQKIGAFEYSLHLNNGTAAIEDLNDFPIKVVNGAMVYIRDVAHVRDGNPPQTNVVHVNGERSVLMSVLKNGATSTLDIVSGIKDKLSEIKSSLPDNLVTSPINDQSIFVRAAINGVVFEGTVAAALTSLMILLFLGNWKSTIIIAVSIPLSILGAIVGLASIGETLNIMTLGGLALAIGILVDDATVTIENINWHLEQGKDVKASILDGAEQIATPAFVSTFCICIVFIPMFFLEGVSRFLFVPMAESVMFAMIISFILSRTLVPTMASYLLKKHQADERQITDSFLVRMLNPLRKIQSDFEIIFERFRMGYAGILRLAMDNRTLFSILFLSFVGVSFLLTPYLGRNFFPSVDSGQILMHARVPIGTRIEETSARFTDIQEEIRHIIPESEISTLVNNIGIPISSINMVYNNTGLIGSQDGDIQISLKSGHKKTDEYVRKLREELPVKFPGVVFSFPPADIVSQILNFGSPAPIDLQIRGGKLDSDFEYANNIIKKLRRVPGIADVRIQQSRNNPLFYINVDRTRAQLAGLTTRDITNSLLVNLTGSSQVAPTFWLNPENGVSYGIAIQTPQYWIDSLNSLYNLPVTGSSGLGTQILGGIANFNRGQSQAVVSQYDIQSMVEIYATTQGRDLGAVAEDIRKIISDTGSQVPKGSHVELIGQIKTMDNSFFGLGWGLIGAIVLIYFLIVVNFQSWSDPFVIIMALPAAIAGIVWMLFVTYTPLSVPALTGAIMCMGVATANSVLVISFARERLNETGDATLAALEAGYQRCRPVIMTALAMVIGMAPMAMGFGEGGEQNAPLGRAVIGGLFFATIATLVFVPVVFSIVHRGRSGNSTSNIKIGEINAV